MLFFAHILSKIVIQEIGVPCVLLEKLNESNQAIMILFNFFFFFTGPSTSFSSCSKYRSKSKTPANEQKKPAEVRTGLVTGSFLSYSFHVPKP